MGIFNRKKEMQPAFNNQVYSNYNSNSTSLASQAYVNSSLNGNSSTSNWGTSTNNWDTILPYQTYTTDNVFYPYMNYYQDSLLDIFNASDETQVKKLLEAIQGFECKSAVLKLIVANRHFSEEFLLEYYLGGLIDVVDIEKVHKHELISNIYASLKLAIEAKKDEKK